MLMPMVAPSGSALATTSGPILPLAPGLFSTVKVCFRFGCSLSAMSRAPMWGVDPAANGTMIRTGLVGQSCAMPGAAPRRTANSASSNVFISAFSCDRVGSRHHPSARPARRDIAGGLLEPAVEENADTGDGGAAFRQDAR